MDTLLTMRDVVVELSGRTVLQRLTLEVKAGEWIAVFGPNGSGKTALLAAAAGRVQPRGGSVLTPDPNRRLQSARVLVAGLPAPLRFLSVHRLLAWSAARGGGTPAARAAAIAETAAILNLRRMLDSPAARLSGGQRTALHVAMALCRRPALLLLDEVLPALDETTRERLVAHLEQRCVDDGMAVVHATVRADEAARADRVVLLDNGRVLASAPPSELLEACQGDRVMIEAADPRSVLPTLTGIFDVEVCEEGGELAFRAADGVEVAARVLRRPAGGVRVVRVRPPDLWDAWRAMRSRSAS